VLVIGRKTRHVAVERALEHVAGVTLALDITARELQKKDGQWTRAKGYDTFCPLGPAIAPFAEAWLAAPIRTRLNGKMVQDDRTSSMIFPPAVLIAHLSACMTLEPGDLILTGTPAGVGPLADGDRVEVEVAGPVTLRLGVECRLEA
jgi:2-keto-4-pentenoate hydratase/2-oxohepta-3-ene-1,7-dioic acid hydratase in catechol pathway